MTTHNEICRMDAVTLAAHIRDKRLSPVEVIEAVLARMERLEPRLHAFCTPTPELARVEAKRVEADIMAGRPVGPLAGVPIGHKDLILTKGVRTASGSLAYKDFVPEEDDIVVERIRAAGAIMIGKTNAAGVRLQPAGHNPVFETTRNPWNTVAARSGGSSAGAGAAVATGMSGRWRPAATAAARCGFRLRFADCTGMKASMGRIPLYPGCARRALSRRLGLGNARATGRSRAPSPTRALMTVGRRRGPTCAIATACRRRISTGRNRMRGDLRGVRVASAPIGVTRRWIQRCGESSHRRSSVFERDLGCIVEEANPDWQNPSAAFFAIMMAESDLKRDARDGAQVSDVGRIWWMR